MIQDHWSSGLDLSPLNPNFYLALSSIDQYFFLFVFFFFQFIFSMTIWRYYEAKTHGKMLDGVGLPVSDTPSRDKIDSSSLEHLIDVITSSHIIKDLPFGQKTL